MNTYLLAFLIYYAISLVATIVLFYIKSKTDNEDGNIPLWKNVATSLIVALILPIAIILIIAEFIIERIRKKPNPIPEPLRSLVGKDMVKYRGQYLTIKEFNEKYGQNYTLKDVYGEDAPEVNESKEHVDGPFSPECNVPGTLGMPMVLKGTPVEFACEALGNAIVHGMFGEFENMLADDVETIIYKSKTIKGKQEVVEYWKGWKERFYDTKKATEIKLENSKYNNDIVLVLEIMVVYPILENKKIKTLILASKNLESSIGCADMTRETFDYNEIKDKLEPLDLPAVAKEFDLEDKASIVNRIPCLKCGTKSENLEWYRFDENLGNAGYIYTVSVCPHCKKIVEAYPHIRYRC